MTQTAYHDNALGAFNGDGTQGSGLFAPDGTPYTSIPYISRSAPGGSALGLIDPLTGALVPTGASSPKKLSVLNYGVVSSTSLDQTTAIQNALNTIAALGAAAYFPAGTYCYTSNGTFPCSIYGDGNRLSELRCISSGSLNSVWDVQNLTGFVCTGMWFNSINSTGFVSNEIHGSIRLTGVTRYEISYNDFTGSVSAAIMQRNCTRGRVVFNRLENIWHDGIHHTDATYDVFTGFNEVINGGDDCFACIGYRSKGVLPRRITIMGNIVRGTKYARGVACVGAADIIITGNQLYNVKLAGVYVASESGYQSYGCENIKVTNNLLDGCGLNTACYVVPGAPSYSSQALAPIHLVAYSGHNLNQVYVAHNTVKNSSNHAIYLGAGGGNFVDFDVIQNDVTDAWDPYNKNGFAITTTSATTADVTINLNHTMGVSVGQQVIDVTQGNTPLGTVVSVTSNTVVINTACNIGNGVSCYFVGGGFQTVATPTVGSSATTTMTVASTTGISIASNPDYISNIYCGMIVTGTNIAAGTVVVGVTATTVTLSQAPSSTVTNGTTLTFTQPTFFTPTSQTVNGAVASGASVTLNSATGVVAGMGVRGTNIATGTFITAVSGAVITLSQAVINTGLTNGQTLNFDGFGGNTFSGIQIYAGAGGRINSNRLTRIGQYGIFINNSFSNRLTVAGNNGFDISMANPAGRFITVNGTLSTGQLLNLESNYMALPSNWPRAFDSFIYCDKANFPYTEWHENNRVQNNALNFNFNGTQAPTSITVGASPYTYTVTSPSGELVTVTSGTVSAISVTTPGVTANTTGLTSGLFPLKVGESITVTYSVAPTMNSTHRVGQ